MSNNKMLIDATHPEETRVVVLRGGRVEEFDFESAARKLLRGNIYLAKVTRVEPSLQAAFVDYGGNRHGFLAFNEIHPDYYQIPVADRQALLEQEAAAEAEEEAAVDAHAEALALRKDVSDSEDDENEDHLDDDESEEMEPTDEAQSIAADPGDGDEDQDAVPSTRTVPEGTLPNDDVISEAVATEGDDQTAATVELDGEAQASAVDGEGAEPSDVSETTSQTASENTGQGSGSNGAAVEVDPVEQVGNDEDALEELAARPRRRPRSYKIQEVIKRRQVILVQVVKEERGNKGAALTTYLSLAGRYTVLMPNTARGGGISRKITNPQDRKRLKAIAADLEVPEGMGLIIRTAGAARTKQEIRRDFEYLLRLWESVRELTLESQAPSLVYEEGNLIKRSIRDLYNKEVEEVLVAGPEAHRDAKDFMRMLMPSHAKNVVLYQEPEPLFTRFQIERQLNAMFSPYVTLRSGGYLVINQTEALVAVDVNSGKATHEFSIEQTANNTNLEAADEIARQLKLRDLAGLIVIDFIDMEEKRNNRGVERRLKEALRHDRARIQVGRISHFGLMEMSRQRLRTGVLEGSTTPCPHCQGTGIIRSTESIALAVLRGLEDAITSGARTPLVAMTTPAVALYILNNKRPFIIDMETRHGLPISVLGTDKLAGANFTIEKGAAPAQPQRRTERNVVNMDWGFEGEGAGDVGRDEPAPARRSEDGGDGTRRKRRRRRSGRRGDRPEADYPDAGERAARSGNGSAIEGARHDEATQNGEPFDIEASEGKGEEDEKPTPQRSRRRGRRGGRRGRERQTRAHTEETTPGMGDQPDVGQRSPEPTEANPVAPTAEVQSAERYAEPQPNLSQSSVPEVDASPITKAEPGGTEPGRADDEAGSGEGGESKAKPRKRVRRSAGSSKPRIERIVVGKGEANDDDPSPSEDTPKESNAPVRKGWWQRRLGSG